jgi:hypothetical protein
MAVDLKYGRVTTEFGTIGDDEPVVVFRAQDKLLPKVLVMYFTLCQKEGSPSQHLEKIVGAIEAVEEWQKNNFTQIPQSNPPA